MVFAAAIVLLLAYTNGANDNFKGVATLLGSGTTSYRRALLWATLTTVCGSLAALVLARGLLAAFSGKGLVPPEVASDTMFSGAVGLSVGVTVLTATRLGLPVSTTHALIGALVGAGLLVSPTGVDGAKLGGAFLVPLLTSPLIAAGFAGSLYPLMRSLRQRLGVTPDTCVCVRGEVRGVLPGVTGAGQVLKSVRLPYVSLGTRSSCRVHDGADGMGVSARPLLDSAHYLSAGAVSFARGLNDTPKIAALLLVGPAFSPSLAIVGVGLFMALGGLLGSSRVAETMSHRVTEMNPGQGLIANAVTALVVIGASRLGMPVSTTHVSCGSLFGIGAVTGGGYWKTIRRILLAWVVTLPAAAVLAVAFVFLLGRVA